MTEEALTTEQWLDRIGGRIHMYEIWKDAPEGGILLGHRIIEYDRHGKKVSERDVYNVRMFYE